MKNPRNLFCAIALTLLLGLSTTAVSQVSTNCEPGQILTPCGSSVTGQIPTPPDDGGTPSALGQIETPPDSASLTDIAANVLQLMLSFF